MFDLFQADISSVVEQVNDKHLVPWAEACQKSNIDNTPLSPYMGEELLYKKHLYLDNSKLKNLGFEVTVPQVTRESLEEVSSILNAIINVNYYL